MATIHEVHARKHRIKMLRLARNAMRAHHLIARTKGMTSAGTAEEFYGFRVLDVIAMYAHKAGVGPGLWFRLEDGRVVDAFGRRSGRRARYIARQLPRFL